MNNIGMVAKYGMNWLFHIMGVVFTSLRYLINMGMVKWCWIWSGW